MNEYIEVLKFYVSQNPPAYTRDANSILELLYYYYRERKADIARFWGYSKSIS